MTTIRAFAVVGLLLPLAAAQTTISVSTPTALREAIADGAHIEVANDMVIDTQLVIPAGYDVEIASTNGATLFATNWASHFKIDGKLRLENLVLTNGSAVYDGEWRCNRDESCSGGALHVDEGASLTLVDCVVANSSAQFGGGLYGYKSGTIEIYRTTFAGNYIQNGKAGGAIYTHEHKTLIKIVESAFVSNSAPKSGALHLGGDTNIFDTQFVGNKATSYGTTLGQGGAINVHRGAVTIAGSTFVNNEAVMYGPAVYVYPSSAVLTVVSSIFDGNIGNGTVSFLRDTSQAPPVIDCVASCDSLGGGTCNPVDCGGCALFGSDCDLSACSCYSCDCAQSTFQPTPIPTGPTPLPTRAPTRPPFPRPTTSSPTLAPTTPIVWWQAAGSSRSTDGARSVSSLVTARYVLLFAFRYLAG